MQYPFTFTARQVAEKAIELADQNPHFVYKQPEVHGMEMCLYVDPADPTKGHCLFGQALVALGVPTVTLRLHERRGVERVIDDLLGVTMGHELVMELAHAQGQQDYGEPWADAVARLREYLGRTAA